MQQVPRQSLLAGLPGRGGSTELGLGRGQRQVQVAEHGGRPAQLTQRRLGLIRQQGLAPRVGKRGDRLRLPGGLGYLGQGGRTGANLAAQALPGEEGGHPLQDLHAVVPLLRSRQAGQHLPGAVRGIGTSAGGILQDAQPPRR
jgi:hypothetical protein